MSTAASVRLRIFVLTAEAGLDFFCAPISQRQTRPCVGGEKSTAPPPPKNKKKNHSKNSRKLRFCLALTGCHYWCTGRAQIGCRVLGMSGRHRDRLRRGETAGTRTCMLSIAPCSPATSEGAIHWCVPLCLGSHGTPFAGMGPHRAFHYLAQVTDYHRCCVAFSAAQTLVFEEQRHTHVHPECL